MCQVGRVWKLSHGSWSFSLCILPIGHMYAIFAKFYAIISDNLPSNNKMYALFRIFWYKLDFSFKHACYPNLDNKSYYGAILSVTWSVICDFDFVLTSSFYILYLKSLDVVQVLQNVCIQIYILLLDVLHLIFAAMIHTLCPLSTTNATTDTPSRCRSIIPSLDKNSSIVTSQVHYIGNKIWQDA